MKRISLKLLTGIALLTLGTTSCDKFLDINKDPDNIPADNPPVAQLLTSAQINLAFNGGSDLFRYSTLIAQQISGQASQPNQTYEYSRYNITGSDANNVWGSIFSNTLADLELIIKASSASSPYYSGVARIMKAYQYSLVVDAWGDVPFTDALQLDANTQPKYDAGDAIYKALIASLDQAITDLGAASSIITPAANSLIYPGTFATTKTNWIKLANTLKLRMFLHYSKKDPAYMLAQITALVNNAAAPVFASNADNFQLAFIAAPNNTNPIHQFEVNRANYLFADNNLVTLMNGKSDPRRAFYFTPFPYASSPATYKGTVPGDVPSVNFSRMHTYLRGAASGTPTPNAQGGITATALTYTGAAPIRMLTYAEYCFIRAEAALRGAPGVAQTWYQAGITASMTDAGVLPADIATYIAARGTLDGTAAQQMQKVIEEKYVANYGVSMEPWTDYRRTGYPALTPPSNASVPGAAVPRSLFYPQSEIDLNPNAKQKGSMADKVFWDN
ncbi:MAG: SusD/RagB family nutrient-binding outer membrane lipoprotein [Bacteroidota bacterium]